MIRRLDTHYYDGKIERNALVDEEIAALREQTDDGSITEHAKRSVIIRFFTKTINILTQKADISMKLIIADMINKITYIRNYDAKSELWVGDLLYLICNKNARKSLVDSMNLYFEDMTRGLCARGKPLRLYQILTQIIDPSGSAGGAVGVSTAALTAANSSLSGVSNNGGDDYGDGFDGQSLKRVRKSKAKNPLSKTHKPPASKAKRIAEKKVEEEVVKKVEKKGGKADVGMKKPVKVEAGMKKVEKKAAEQAKAGKSTPKQPPTKQPPIREPPKKSAKLPVRPPMTTAEKKRRLAEEKKREEEEEEASESGLEEEEEVDEEDDEVDEEEEEEDEVDEEDDEEKDDEEEDAIDEDEDVIEVEM